MSSGVHRNCVCEKPKERLIRHGVPKSDAVVHGDAETSVQKLLAGEVDPHLRRGVRCGREVWGDVVLNDWTDDGEQGALAEVENLTEGIDLIAARFGFP